MVTPMDPVAVDERSGAPAPGPAAGSAVPSSSEEHFFAPEMDAIERPDGYVLAFDVPGVDKQRISVRLDGCLLTVSGHRRDSAGRREHAGLLRSERRTGSFERIVALPGLATASPVKVRYWNGVLIVSVPKAAAPGGSATGRASPAVDAMACSNPGGKP